jgi:hypothetical protein
LTLKIESGKILAIYKQELVMRFPKLTVTLLIGFALVLSGCGAKPTAQPTTVVNIPSAQQGGTAAYPAANPGAAVQPQVNTGDAAYPVPQGKTTPGSVVPTAQSNAGDAAYPAQGGDVKVTKKDGALVVITLDAAKKIASGKVTIDGKESTGFKLSDLISAANTSISGKVTVTATNGSVTLTQDQAGSAYVGFVNNQLRLMVSGTASDKWLIGITAIKLE